MKVLMIGAGRDVQGGVSSVVNQYFAAGLDQLISLEYLPTMEDGNKLKKLFVAIRAYAHFCSIIHSFDILHVHMSHRKSFYRKSRFIKKARKSGVKIVIHMHGSEFDVFYHDECNDRQKKEVKCIFSIADAVIALSEEWKEKLSVFCDRSKITVLHNAVMMPEYIRSNYQDQNVLFLGRLGKRKGTYDLIEAIPRVLSSVPEARFFLGGDGDIDQIQKRIEELSINDAVTCLGWIRGEQKEKLLQECSTFILPSYHEGMPMSILEAMSYGEAVISTDVGGIPQVIINGENGILIHPGDIQAITDALLTTLQGKKERLGKAAYTTIIRQFNASENVKQLVLIYESII